MDDPVASRRRGRPRSGLAGVDHIELSPHTLEAYARDVSSQPRPARHALAARGRVAWMCETADTAVVVLPFDEVGEGPAVVLLHAGVADRTMWAEHLQPLALSGHRVVAMDLPGFGHAPVTPGEQAPWA